MKIPTALRLALVPIGVAIAAKGLQYLSDEADRLDAEIDARRAELVASYTKQGWIFPACEHRPNTKHENITACQECPAPEDFPPAPVLEHGPGEDSPAEQAPRRRHLFGNVAAAAVGFGAGLYLSRLAARRIQQRAATGLPDIPAGGFLAAIAHLIPTSQLPDDDAAPLDGDHYAELPEICGVYPAFGEPPTPCTLPPHDTFRHSWEGGHGDPVAPDPTPEQVWDTHAEPARFVHSGPCDPDDCAECRRSRKQ